MDDCVQILRGEFGILTASEPNLSRWETGAISRPKCVEGLIAYCDAYVDAEAASQTEDGSEFDRLVSQIADEPLLGPLQTELVRGISRRLRTGPSLSAEDRATYLDQARILRLIDW